MDRHASDSTLVFFVNGRKVIDSNVDPEWTLLYYLRTKLRLCGTKLGCAEGGCGACTVMVSKFNWSEKKIRHMSVNACLSPVCAMHGLAVTTVEGIGSVRTKLHPVQERIAKAHGSQCGFCTPGMVMSMYTLLRSLPNKPNMQDLEVAFQGNLCRCTGYRPIIEGYRTFTEEWEQQRLSKTNGVCGMGDKCCRNKNNQDNVDNGNSEKVNGEIHDETLFNPDDFKPFDATQEPIFPSELQVSPKYNQQFLVIKGPRITWYRPTTLEQFLELKSILPSAKIVNGNTEIGVEVKFKNCLYPVLILPNQIAEMTSISVEDNSLKVGASVTLSELETTLNDEIKKQPEFKTRIFKAIVEMLHWFAGKQIRNVGAVGGNIMTGSPISDLNPIFMAAGCKLELRSHGNKTRYTVMDHKFWTGYRKNTVEQDEVLTAIFIPYSEQNQYFKAYKQAKRRDDDIAIVNAAFNLHLDGNKIKQLALSYGGMAPTTVLATKTGTSIIGKEWDSEMLNQVYANLIEEIPLDPGVPGGVAQYRRSLTLSFFFKFYLTVSDLLGLKNFAENEKSGAKTSHNLVPKSSQYFTVIPNTQEKHDLVGRPIVHKTAYQQTTGEAIYCDDVPKLEGELYMSLVLSTKPYAKIVSIDASEALAFPGVVNFFSAYHSPPKHNECGPIFKDEQIFAHETVFCQGQTIGAIIAEDPLIAQRAKKLVKVEYEDLKPVIITIEDAIREKSFLRNEPFVMKCGNSDKVFAETNNILEGEIKIGGQEHFYFETNAAIAIPKYEDDELEVISSSQHPSELQHLISHALGITSNKVVCKVKRMGGAFGGKESRSHIVAVPAAIAAFKLQRPVRCMLDRDEDMVMSGHRHPFLGKYKVAFSPEGKLLACEVHLYSNGGYSMDLSKPIMERAMFHFQNGYKIPNVTCYGYICKTNMQTNTAFRGFGAPQGMLVGEIMVRHVAETLGKDVSELIEINLYNEGEDTHYNEKIVHCTLKRCWSECKKESNYDARKLEVENFNKDNRWRKRGIAMVPTMFGVSFTTLFLNQAGALVLIYTDGSVLISHGGTEMGQGLHTKMIQVASRALGISADKIHISETSTDKVPNTSASAASASSDLNGMAIVKACNEINERLKPIKEANPKDSWEAWINKAYFSRISLAASAFYKTPDIGYDFVKNTGMAFNYFSFGAACSEIEIDCLTGDHQVLRTDIVMDVGESINPAIDVGQVEGAFMQGYGLFTLEELIVSPEGTLYSRGPGAYKIPGFSDIPAQFNVSLLKGAPNPRAVYSSKAVGEPPLFLASSVYFAIRDAIKSARKEVGLSGWFNLESPATSARIRMACEDHITQKFPEPPAKSFTPWNVSL